MQNTQQQMKKVPARRRIFEIIQIAGGKDLASRAFDLAIISLIILSIVVTTLDTFTLRPGAQTAVDILDAVCMILFTVEYLLRLWTADLLFPEKEHPYLGYVFSWSAIIDLLSFLPFYLEGIVPPGMVVFRLIRVVRILRLFRINYYSDPLTVITSVLKRKASQILASLFLVFMLMLAASLLMYYAEHEAQPEVFSNGFSGLWWAVSTLSTIGYGDIYPVTFLGKALAIIISLLGMGVVAIPTGIITAGFMEVAGEGSPKEVSESAGTGLRILDITGCGTHVKAPAEYVRCGNTVEQLSLDRLVGRCVVTTQKGVLSPQQISDIISTSSGQAEKRILLRGECTLSASTATYMCEMGLMAVGLQGDGIEDGDACRILASHGIPVLAGLDLNAVEDGEYLLSAAPVRMNGKGSAPCRAVLMG